MEEKKEKKEEVYWLTNSPPVEPTRCVRDGFSLKAANRLGSCFFRNSYVVKKVAAIDTDVSKTALHRAERKENDSHPGALPAPTIPTPL